MEIVEVKAFKVNRKLFETEQEAKNYLRREIEPLSLGDHVSIKGFTGKSSDKGGLVCCIEGDRYWFTVSGMMPEKYLLGGKVNKDAFKYKIDGKIYSWELGCHPRKNISKLN